MYSTATLLEHYTKLTPFMRAVQHLRTSCPNENGLRDTTVDFKSGEYMISITHTLFETAVCISYNSVLDVISCSDRGKHKPPNLLHTTFNMNEAKNRSKMFFYPNVDTGRNFVQYTDGERIDVPMGLSEEEYFQESTVENIPSLEMLEFVEKVGEVYDFMGENNNMRISMDHTFFSLNKDKEFDILIDTVWGYVNNMILHQYRMENVSTKETHHN